MNNPIESLRELVFRVLSKYHLDDDYFEVISDEINFNLDYVGFDKKYKNYSLKFPGENWLTPITRAGLIDRWTPIVVAERDLDLIEADIKVIKEYHLMIVKRIEELSNLSISLNSIEP